MGWQLAGEPHLPRLPSGVLFLRTRMHACMGPVICPGGPSPPRIMLCLPCSALPCLADFVEIMAPMFSRAMLARVRSLLDEDSYTGGWVAGYGTAGCRGGAHCCAGQHVLPARSQPDRAPGG